MKARQKAIAQYRQDRYRTLPDEELERIRNKAARKGLFTTEEIEVASEQSRRLYNRIWGIQ